MRAILLSLGHLLGRVIRLLGARGARAVLAENLRSRFHDGFDSHLVAMDAELLLKRTICEVGIPLWVERVGVLPDFYVAPDFGFARVNQARPTRLDYKTGCRRAEERRAERDGSKSKCVSSFGNMR